MRERVLMFCVLILKSRVPGGGGEGAAAPAAAAQRHRCTGFRWSSRCKEAMGLLGVQHRSKWLESVAYSISVWSGEACSHNLVY